MPNQAKKSRSKKFKIILIIIFILGLLMFILNKESKNKDLIIKTNKTIYEYGEPVEIEVTRYFPERDEKRYIIGKCNFVISNEGIELDFYCTGGYQCEYYCRSFDLGTNKLETDKVIWDQKVCFDTSRYGDSVLPGNYEIRIKCNITDISVAGFYHGFIISDGIDILIKEP